MFSNAFGHFDPSGRRFVVTDRRTPMPWVNVISNGHYGLVVSQNGGGFSWLDNSQLNVLTRWEMDLIRDDRGRFLFISDLETGEVWSAAPAPCWPEYSSYECEHTQGQTTFSTEHRGIFANWTLAVTPDDPVEVWRLRLENRTDRPRKLRISSFFEWCCGVAPDTKREFHRLFFTTKHDPARRAIIVRKNMWDIPSKDERDHWNKPWPYVAGHAFKWGEGVEFDSEHAIGEKRAFTGHFASISRPTAMTSPRPTRPADKNVFGRFGDAAAALGGDLSLQPGQTVSMVFTLAVAKDEKTLLELLDRHTTPEAADAAIDGSRRMWDGLLAPSSVRSGMPDFDLLNNTWLPYQAISGRLWGRTGYYQQSGAFGFRDQLQDSLVWLARDPSRTRQQILLHAAHQFVDGSVYHWWHPLAEFGLRTACSDDYLWLPMLTAIYIKDTGDWSILDEHVAFVDNESGATLLEHCTRSIARSLSRHSERGLPLIGSCDWNDGLSAVGVGGKGESVWLAQWLAFLLAEFAPVVEHGGATGPNPALAATYLDHRTSLAEAINAHAWDGDSGGKWYRAATRDDGRWIGTATNEEGRVFLNTQTWAVLSGTAPPDREAAAWASVKQHLLRPMGPLLSHPAYTEPDATIGYITRYAPGLRENGGVYMHAAAWALAAACKRRDTQAVEQIWRAISPPLRGQEADAYQAEPFVTPGNVDGPESATPGRAGWTWYTGSAAWLNRVSLEWIIGIRPEWDGLHIDPCPFAAMGKVVATRPWRGRSVRVSFDAAEFSPTLSARITVNGRVHFGNVIRADEFIGDMDLNISVSWGVHVTHATARPGAVAAGHRVAKG